MHIYIYICTRTYIYSVHPRHPVRDWWVQHPSRGLRRAGVETSHEQTHIYNNQHAIIIRMRKTNQLHIVQTRYRQAKSTEGHVAQTAKGKTPYQHTRSELLICGLFSAAYPNKHMIPQCIRAESRHASVLRPFANETGVSVSLRQLNTSEPQK